MRLLIGWCLRGVIVSAIGAFIVAILSALSTYFIADYLIDYDDWQRQAKR